MTHDDLERLLSTARDYNEPPSTPRDEMWAAIQAGRGRDHTDTDADVVDLDARRARRSGAARRHGWPSWTFGVAAAAILVLGFGLGRLADRSTAGSAGTAEPAVATAPAEASLPVRLAAADHMGEAEAMLTLYRTSDRAEDRAAAAAWARALLNTTRLLLDSRAGEDPQLAELLSDLELVLVQVASVGEGDREDQELIEEGMDERQLLTKLRTAARPLQRAM